MQFVLNGKTVTCKGTKPLLFAALDAGVYIPHLCAHPLLPPQTQCGLCYVYANGTLVRACETAVEDNMRVETEGETLDALRRMALELMLAAHPHDCTGCKAYLQCELQALLQYMGVAHARMHTVEKRTSARVSRGLLIVREQARCVGCGRCVRVCREVRGVGVLDYRHDGDETYVGTADDRPLDETDCRGCGACVAICPTGALLDAEGVFNSGLPCAEALVPCRAACAAHIDVPRYLRFLGGGDAGSAAAVIREKTPFPLTLGHVCNHRCEDDCRRGKQDEAVAICDMKRLAGMQDTAQPWRAAATARKSATGKRVSIAGAGPAGLTAAYYLSRKGHDVTVFERAPVAGGMPALAIPARRLPPSVTETELAIIREAGVRIVTNTDIQDFAALKKDCDAALVATGAWRGRLPKEAPAHSLSALALLKTAKLHGTLPAGDNFAVIGGGSVAFDCADVLLDAGKSVTLVCLEKGGAMPATRREIDAALSRGVRLLDGHTVTDVKNGILTVQAITGFRFDGGLHVDVSDSAPVMLAADSVVYAMGQASSLTADCGAALDAAGRPFTVEGQTSIPGVFAAGDAVTGTRFVIDAVAAGREAAMRMDRYLGGDGNIDDAFAPDMPAPERIGVIEGFWQKKRTGTDAECARCLQCDLRQSIRQEPFWTAYREDI